MNHTFLKAKASVIFNKRYQMQMGDAFEFLEDTSSSRNKVYNEILNGIVQINNKEFLYKNNSYLVYNRELNENIVCIEAGKRQQFEKSQPDKTGFTLKYDTNYPIFRIYFHRVTQLVFIEINRSVMNENALTNFVEFFLSLFYEIKKMEIVIQPLYEKAKFWEILENDINIIKELEFELLAPNLFDANSTAKEFAQKMRDRNNAERVRISLISETGVIISKDDIELNSYVDYTSQGCGKWKVKIKNRDRNVTTTIRSRNVVKKVKFNLDIQDKNNIELEIAMINSMVADEKNS